MLNIMTNNQPRSLMYGSELSDKEKEDFDYIDAEEIDGHEFVKYKGRIYDTSEFMVCPDDDKFKGWQGISSDSFFSGVLLKYTEDMEEVIMGWYCS